MTELDARLREQSPHGRRYRNCAVGTSPRGPEAPHKALKAADRALSQRARISAGHPYRLGRAYSCVAARGHYIANKLLVPIDQYIVCKPLCHRLTKIICVVVFNILMGEL